MCKHEPTVRSLLGPMPPTMYILKCKKCGHYIAPKHPHRVAFEAYSLFFLTVESIHVLLVLLVSNHYLLVFSLAVAILPTIFTSYLLSWLIICRIEKWERTPLKPFSWNRNTGEEAEFEIRERQNQQNT